MHRESLPNKLRNAFKTHEATTKTRIYYVPHEAHYTLTKKKKKQNIHKLIKYMCNTLAVILAKKHMYSI